MNETLMSQLVADSQIALPLLGWVLAGIAVLCVQMIFRNQKVSTLVSLLGLGATIVYSLWSFDPQLSETLYFGSVSFDSFSQFFNILALVICFSVILMSMPGVFDRDIKLTHNFDQYPEFLTCVIFSGFGATVATSAVDITSFFIGIETLSIGLYGLCGFYRSDIRSTESAFKYLLIGSFSTVILLFGLSLLYGATGATNYADIAKVIAVSDYSLLTLSLMFLTVGFGFKLALVPFHLYTPDVYEGAPTPITAYLATISKVAALGAGLRMFWGPLQANSDLIALWTPLWMALCLCSIVFGNLGALQQRSLKKLLAFSSISHAGFLGLALLVAGPVFSEGGDVSNTTRFSLLTYIAVYSIMSLGIFAVIHRLENRAETFMLDDLRGLGEKRFGISALLSLFVLGMAGLPPFAGFMIKFWVLQELVLQGHVVAAIVAVLGTLVGMAYYLRILKLLFMDKDGRALGWNILEDRVFSLRTVAIVAMLLTLIGGIRPSFYADWIFQTLGLK